MSRTVSARQRWRRIISKQQSSGITVTAFCRRHTVPVSSFFAWKRRLASRRQGPGAFVAVKTIDDAGGGQGAIELPAASIIELCLANGRRLILRRGFEHELLLEVIDVLEGKP